MLEENFVEESEEFDTWKQKQEFQPKRQQNIPLRHGKKKSKQVHRSVLGELV